MVHPTIPLAVRISPTVRKAEDLLTGRRNGRRHIKDTEVPFIERTPLSLKNIVSNTSQKTNDKACMDEMMSVIGCLSKFDQNQAMCTSEVAAFQKCFSTFKKSQAQKKAFRESGEMPLGPYAKMDGVQMNKYMSKFMQSNRKGEFHANSVYKKGARDR